MVATIDILCSRFNSQARKLEEYINIKLVDVRAINNRERELCEEQACLIGELTLFLRKQCAPHISCVTREKC